MKTLATLTRHGITYLVGLLVAWFTLHLTAPDELKTATDAANALVEPLVIVAGFVAVVLSRLAMPFVNNLFRRGAGEKGDSGGGLNLLGLGGMMMIGTAAVGTLPSCTPGQSTEYPVTGFVSYTDPQTGAQVGMNIGQPKKAKKAKAPKVIPAK
jgi:hypothetical protein